MVLNERLNAVYEVRLNCFASFKNMFDIFYQFFHHKTQPYAFLYAAFNIHVLKHSKVSVRPISATLAGYAAVMSWYRRKNR